MNQQTYSFKFFWCNKSSYKMALAERMFLVFGIKRLSSVFKIIQNAIIFRRANILVIEVCSHDRKYS